MRQDAAGAPVHLCRCAHSRYWHRGPYRLGPIIRTAQIPQRATPPAPLAAHDHWLWAFSGAAIGLVMGGAIILVILKLGWA